MGPGDYLPIPEAAKQNTPEGAKAFVQFFWDNFNHAAQYPTTGAVSRLCLPSSKSCEAIERAITNLRKDGERLSAPVTGLSELREYEEFNAAAAKFSVRIQDQPVDLIGPDGKVKRSVPAQQPYSIVMTVAWNGERWHLVASETLQ